MAESKIHIQEGVEMQETYTFSRALHMMRYGGKKMRCIEYPQVFNGYYFVENNKLFWFNGRENIEATFNTAIRGTEIMGSWVEVHG